MLFLGIFFF